MLAGQVKISLEDAEGRQSRQDTEVGNYNRMMHPQALEQKRFELF